MGKFFEALQKSDEGKAASKPSLIDDSTFEDDKAIFDQSDEITLLDRKVPDKSIKSDVQIVPPNGESPAA